MSKSLEQLNEIKKYIWGMYIFKNNPANHTTPNYQLEVQTLRDWSDVLESVTAEQQKLYVDEIADFISEANKYGLINECAYSAFTALKDDPTLSIKQALNIGLAEWIK